MRRDLANRGATPSSVRELLDRAKVVEGHDAAASRELVQRARVLARGQQDQPGEAEAFYRLASLAYSSGETNEAYVVALDAHDLASRCGAIVVAAWALNLMGVLHFNAGNHSEALSCCLQSLEQYRATEHRFDEGTLLNTIASIHQTLGDSDRALVTYESALAISQTLDRPDLDALTLANMAQLHSERQEYILAVSLGRSALDLAREHSLEFVPDVLTNLGEAHTGLRDSLRSWECLDEALRLLDERAESGAPTSPTSITSVRTARGRAALAEGDLSRAADDLRIALRLAREAKNPRAELTVHELLVEVHRQLGDFEGALEHQEARFSLHRGMFDQGSDLRIKALLVAHDGQHDRQQLEEARRRQAELESLLSDRTRQVADLEMDMSRQLALLADDREPGAGGHALRVGDLAHRLAVALGDSAEEAEDLRVAARLHDIGKVSAPDEVLLKAGPLSADDIKVIKWHTERWAQVLADSTSTRAQLGSLVARHHHERWDGTGHPAGLRGGDIPRAARIVSVADVFDTLTHDSRDQPAWSHRDATAYIVGGSGTEFDPQVVDAFADAIGRAGPSPT